MKNGNMTSAVLPDKKITSRLVLPLYLALFAVAFSSALTQITFVRETWNVFDSNETVISLIVAFWRARVFINSISFGPSVFRSLFGSSKKTGYHAGRIFTADFAGAAPGSVLCAALLVPAIGAPASFAVLSIAKLICFCRR